MKDEYTIKLKDDAKPFALTVPRKVPMPLYEETKHEIERMLKSGVISPVDHPTDWCVPMVVTPTIVNLPAPKNVHEVRVFLGMVNHLSKFAEHLADKTKPIRDLMQKDSQWVWGTPQQQAFEEIKSILTAAPVLALYDPNKDTKVSADASSFGLGGVLLQKQEDQTWRPVMFISRALTPVECRHAQIEKEALALTWACERFSDYIVGKSILAETDHKPLVPLLTTRTLD